MEPALLIVPGLLHGAAMAADEAWFHRRRELPRWERIGHPIDTASVLACFAWLWLRSPGSGALTGFVALALGSTLLVTKDEAIHAERCSAGEHWLHAILFTLHPMILGAAAWLWWLSADGRDGGVFAPWVGLQALLAAAFGVYQLVYWNLIRREGGP
ncbi:MAG: hypothetical protein NDJ90_14770 [Oligoflexia bacterium]|nr:hypothetical protein [Oligoflexia bacterium]